VSWSDHTVAQVRELALPGQLEDQLLDRLALGAREYGDQSLDRPRSELIGELVEESLDLIGWALIAEAACRRQTSVPRAVALRARLAPVVHQAGVIAAYLAQIRDEAIAIETEHAA
jgi:hypothetical protein